MTELQPLSIPQLCQRFGADDCDFETTDDLDDTLQIIGQDRAVEAIEFGVGIHQDGYNLYALGPTGVGKHDLVEEFLEEYAADEASPSDWCYVHNFDKPNEPRVLELPSGRGTPFSEDMEQLVEELQAAIPAAFESDDYQTRKQAIDEEFQERQEEAFESVHRRAEERDITILRTPAGIALAPVRDGEVIPPGEFDELPDEEREEVEEAIEELQGQMQEALKQVPQWERERRERIRKLNREVMSYAIQGPLDELRDEYSELDVVLEHLDAIEDDIIDNAQVFLQSPGPQGGPMGQAMGGGRRAGGPGGPNGAGPMGNGGSGNITMRPSGGQQGQRQGGDEPGAGSVFRRYQVNVLVDNGDTDGAPVVYEDQPALDSLTGRIEHIAQFGALLTDFNLIRPGALHRANGGYLILDARKILMQPFAWEQLKRVLQSGQISIESRRQMMGLANTMSLEPEEIPLDVKVVLLGGRRLYYLLSEMDPEFLELFKVAADFEHDMSRNGDTAADYARYLANLIDDEDLKAFSSDAIARVCDRSSREAGDKEKFSTHAETLRDLLREANYWARKREADVVEPEDVRRAVDAKNRRNSRVRDRMAEQIERETLLIDTDGQEVGQINGLAVLQLGQFAFGKPNRITARVRLGKGEVVDIEREVDLGGPLHSKGVLIISGYLGARFAHDFPLSLSASLVFEQSYGGIDGDSASLAEVCALKSALAEAPIAQNIAITGSVNQRGQVQAIGGVNEKVEGFFDICRRRGLTGDQGVIVPESNIKHLMLRDEVVDAVDDGDFAIWAVSDVDEATSILTGLPAGEADDDRQFPADTLNGRVQQRLQDLADQAIDFARQSNGRTVEE